LNSIEAQRLRKKSISYQELISTRVDTGVYVLYPNFQNDTYFLVVGNGKRRKYYWTNGKQKADIAPMSTIRWRIYNFKQSSKTIKQRLKEVDDCTLRIRCPELLKLIK